MKILIINSDSPLNRGDRAILAGNAHLIRQTFPGADIWSLSQFPERDAAWYGFNFLPMSPYSISPVQLIRLAIFARGCDYIFWGGGELLKDYTNKIGLVYWYLKIAVVRLFNRNIYGAFQGIGPTGSRFSKRLIAATVDLTDKFIVRDEESRNKLVRWGVKVPIISSFDPAVLIEPKPIDNATLAALAADGVDEAFLGNCAGIGLRRWFHYKKSGWLPFRFKRRRPGRITDPHMTSYPANVAAICDRLIEQHGMSLLFVPMHVAEAENDAKFCREVVGLMKHGGRTRILASDNLSPQQLLDVIGRCRLFLGARLHSTILAVSAKVPSYVFYYVDKGRLFFEQIGMERYSKPIEVLAEQQSLDAISAELDDLISCNRAIAAELENRVEQLRARISTDFEALVKVAEPKAC